MSGSTVKLAAAPASGSDYFAIVLGSTVNIGTPSNNTVTSAMIVDGSIVNADISNSADIAGSKLSLVSTSSTAGVIVKGDGSSDGYLQLNCSQNSHGIKLKSPPHSAGQSYTLTFPPAVVNGAFLKTDANGNLSFAAVNTDLVNDTSPQLGGDLASNGHDIKIADATGYDGNNIYMGSDNDTRIIHDGSNFSLENSTGNATIQSAGGVLLKPASGENGVSALANGAVELYHDNGLRANTESYGFKIKNTNDSGATTLKLENNSTANNQVPRFEIQVDLANGKNGGSVQFVRANNYQSSAAADSEIVISPTKNDSNIEIVRITQDYVRLNSNASGIQFNGDNAQANALNDYEEGTYNPTLTGQGGGSISIYSNEDTLSYTKVGNIVHVHGRIRLHIVNNSMSGQARLSLPFTSASGTDTSNQGQSAVATHGVTLSSSSDIGMFLETVGSSSNGYLNITRYSQSWTAVTANQFGGTGATSNHYLAFNHTYQAA